MKYYELNFTIKPLSSVATDLLAAMAGEAGFETFEETAVGMKGYVQQQLFDRQALDDAIRSFPLPDVCITYTLDEAEDRDWNEQWEQEGFEPIIVENVAWKAEKGKCHRVVIHDGRHLGQLPADDGQTAIEIDARMAFGTGTHETTRMVCSTLLDIYRKGLLAGTRVLDCGTGTGILSICALKLGAGEAVGYDIDEWSVDNARHNAVINGVDDHFCPLLGDGSVLNGLQGSFNLVMANINRNILLADMPLFCSKMAPDGRLVLSGFYTQDIPLLVEEAGTLGLSLTSQMEENGWACIVLQKLKK